MVSYDLCKHNLMVLPVSDSTCSECIKSYHRHYGENFEHHIPENGTLLEFAPRGAPQEAMPVVLWNGSDAETSNSGRGRLQRGGKVWVAEKVTQADQGNYTLRNQQGEVLSRSTLTVRGEQRTEMMSSSSSQVRRPVSCNIFVFFVVLLFFFSFTPWRPPSLCIHPAIPCFFFTLRPLPPPSFLPEPGRSFNVTRFTRESLNLPLFLPVPHAHIIFTPKRFPDDSSLGPFDPKPARGSVQLMREGHITDHDLRYRGLVSLGRNGTVSEVVIARLTSRHDGVYEVKDRDGNLVSSTLLQVIGECLDIL